MERRKNIFARLLYSANTATDKSIFTLVCSASVLEIPVSLLKLICLSLGQGSRTRSRRGFPRLAERGDLVSGCEDLRSGLLLVAIFPFFCWILIAMKTPLELRLEEVQTFWKGGRERR